MPAKLKLVTPSPESELAHLFSLENVLLDELRDVRAQQSEARIRYARMHGLLALPSFDRLRQIVGK